MEVVAQVYSSLGVCNATAWELFQKHKVESVSFGNSKYYRKLTVKYIKNRKEESRKAAEQKEKKITVLRQKESQNNLPQATSTSPKQIQPRGIILPSKDTTDS